MKISKLAMSIGLVLSSSMVLADNFTDAVTGGKTTLDMNLRYEFVDQDNDLKNANALTLRTRLNYTTAAYNGVVGVIEFEDSRAVAGVDDYNNTLGKNTDYSVVADPETTE
ncbi:MAG: hypothetical protein QNK26_16250, partial [Moritella sp.]|nr:hypothetical protein [Moritella sp.]